MPFVKFMAGWPGRAARIVLGLALIFWGYRLESAPGWLAIILGAVALSAGLFDFCLFAPLFKMPMSGKAIRGGQK